MLRGGPVVVGVSLWFVSLPLLIHTQSSNMELCYRDFQILEEVNKTARSKDRLGSRLYTPTVNDYMNCSNSTLDCFRKESKVLLSELNMTNKKLIDDLEMLQRRIKKVKSPCSRACELHTAMEAQTFLDNLKEVIMRINSEYCGPV